jgi:hypothetical protein
MARTYEWIYEQMTSGQRHPELVGEPA